MVNLKQKKPNIWRKEEMFLPPRKEILTRIIIIGVIASFIVLIGSIIFSNYYLSKKIAEIESRLLPSPEAEAPPPTPKISLPKILYNLAGEIQKLEKDSLILKATIPQLDENGQPTYKTEIRKVLITPTTKFSRLTIVIQEGGKTGILTETSMTFKDLKVGDHIEVISNQDISQAPEIEATQVRVLPS